MRLRLPGIIALIALSAWSCQKQAEPKSSDKILYKIVLSDPAGLAYYSYRDSAHTFVICPAYYGNFGIDDLQHLTTQLEVSPGATVEGYSDSIQYDYSQPVNLRVIAEDGSDSTYTIRIGYIDGYWYQDDTPVSPMKMDTRMVWAAKESSQDYPKFTFGAGSAAGPVGFGLNIGDAWTMPDSITTPITLPLNDFQTTFVKESVYLHPIQTTLTITAFNRQTRQISGEWDVRFVQGPDMPFNRSKGQFRHFPLN